MLQPGEHVVLCPDLILTSITAFFAVNYCGNLPAEKLQTYKMALLVEVAGPDALVVHIMAS